MMLVDPVFQGIGIIFLVQVFFEHFLFALGDQHFGGLKALEQFIHVFQVALGQEAFSCGDIDEGNTVFPVVQVNGCQEIIGFIIE